MARLALVVILLSLVATMPHIQGLEDESNQVNWAKRLETEEKEVVTILQFYFHDTVSGKNPSAVRVAESPDTNNSLTLFGAVMMADDPLTEGPDATSKLVGRAQGLYGSAAHNSVGLIMAMSYGFVDGIYDGSSISVLGLNSALYLVREMAVVGGTGLFRLARGFAVAQTHRLNPLTGDAIVWYNVTVITSHH